MMLEATNLGLDNIWIRYFNTKALRDKFNIPDNLVPVALLDCGYRGNDWIQNPNHSIRKDLKDIVTYL